MKNYGRITVGISLLFLITVLFQNCGPASEAITTSSGEQSSLLPQDIEAFIVEKSNARQTQSVSDWGNAEKEVLRLHEFPGTQMTNLKREKVLNALGSGSYTPLRRFYSSLDDVYTDFSLDPELIQSCDKRNQNLLQGSLPLQRKWARQYFCSGEFATDRCRAQSYKKIRLNYCLDLDDSLDWVVIQAAILNSAGRTVVIPAGKLFLINQAVVLPTNARIVWQAQTKTSVDGLLYRADGASFLRFVQRPEPSIPESPNEPTFSTGTVITAGNMPFIYSGPNPYRKPGIVRNISLYFPMIDGANVGGENGISFAQGVDGALIHGGTIRNIKFKKHVAGGKAVQCEAGCKNLKIKGLEILNSFIGLNANAIEKYRPIQKFGSGYVSQFQANGIVMRNVDIPFNFKNDMTDNNSMAVNIENFQLLNSGRLTEDAELDLYGRLLLSVNPTSLNFGKISEVNRLSEAKPAYSVYYGGLVTSQGGKNINIKNGTIINSQDYPPLDGLVQGYFQNSYIENVTFKIRINCRLRSNGSKHPSCI